MSARVCALLPAHNEAATVGGAIDALRRQSSPPDRIVVVADNCTDVTADVARGHGAEVFETVGNNSRKAGALNQALRALSLPDVTLIMDADTVIVPRFIEYALRELATADVAAVGAVFTGRAHTWLERCQVNEWARYARQLDRTGYVWVLSGTAAVIRTDALRAVATARGSLLPGEQGDVYLEHALTEDFELTVALRTLNYELRSPSACQSTTELMPTLSALRRQRSRWYAGALQTVGTYGMTKATRRYWGQQAMLALSALAMTLLVVLTVAAAVAGNLRASWFWIAIGVLFWVSQVVTAWRYRGGRVLAMLLLPELLYGMFLQVVFLGALRRRMTGERIDWGHLSAAVHSSRH